MGDEKDAKRGEGPATPIAPAPLKVEITAAKGKDKKKFVIAHMPPPREDAEPWSAKIDSKDEIPATIKYSRDGKEGAVAWGGGSPPKIVFKDGNLNVNIQLVDGLDAAPVASENKGVVTIGAVHQGDAMIIEEGRSKGRDQLAVVKNFTWNDLTRRKGVLKFVADFGSLPDPAGLLFHEGRSAEAVKLYRDLTGTGEPRPSLYYRIAEISMEENEWAAAEAVLMKGIREHEDNARLHYLDGEMWLRRGDVDGATAALRKAIALNDDFAPAWHRLAYLAAQQRSAASEIIEKCTRVFEVEEVDHPLVKKSLLILEAALRAGR